MNSTPEAFVRPARLDDHETLVSFNCLLAEESEGKRLDPARVRSGVRAILDDPAKGRYFVVERGGRVVACLLLTWEYSDWRFGMFWWIQSVYTAAEARGQGMFGMLHEHVRGLAKADERVCGLRLYVERENHRARKTYEHRGMRPTGYLVYEEEFEGTAE
ncbi:MAG: GNAT family N-acetyltransferase [Candidatus Wallbacteria bacterium]|nr:GNAT family N-acetyltransferase [Candidatus Wallbacteria bacterium]